MSIELEIEQIRAEAALRNAEVKRAELLFEVANQYRDRLPDLAIYQMINAGVKILTGQDLSEPRQDS